MEGWWCVRYGDALAWVEVSSAPQALRRSLELHHFGDWTDDARELVVFPQDAYPETMRGLHDYTRVVLNAEPSPPPERRRARLARPRVDASSLSLPRRRWLHSDSSPAPRPRLGGVWPSRLSTAVLGLLQGSVTTPIPQSVERDIVRELGAVYGPYTGRCFTSSTETDIEHIVAASEAHDSGLCAADAATKARFARDLRNLTLAAPEVNRFEKSGKDASEWVPARNRCWFAGRVVEVRRAYGLTIDRREAAALERILAGCESTALEPVVCAVPSASASEPASAPAAGDDALARYDDNRNGKITCKEARRHGITPVPRSHPAYRYMRDGDGDGVVCE